jgi:DedD protein
MAAPASRATKPAASGVSPGVSTRATAGGQVLSGFTIQVAATHTKVDAQKLVNALKSRGYPVFLVTPEQANAGDSLFRVQVGPFPTRRDAENVRGRLSKEGFKPFIRH